MKPRRHRSAPAWAGQPDDPAGLHHSEVLGDRVIVLRSTGNAVQEGVILRADLPTRRNHCGVSHSGRRRNSVWVSGRDQRNAMFAIESLTLLLAWLAKRTCRRRLHRTRRPAAQAGGAIRDPVIMSMQVFLSQIAEQSKLIHGRHLGRLFSSLRTNPHLSFDYPRADRVTWICGDSSGLSTFLGRASWFNRENKQMFSRLNQCATDRGAYDRGIGIMAGRRHSDRCSFCSRTGSQAVRVIAMSSRR